MLQHYEDAFCSYFASRLFLYPSLPLLLSCHLDDSAHPLSCPAWVHLHADLRMVCCSSHNGVCEAGSCSQVSATVQSARIGV